MYRGSNPTARQSQKLIVEALFELMDRKEFSKISVKELCAEAMVSRQTFYSLFACKEEVIELELDTHFERYLEQFKSRRTEPTLKGLCKSIIIYLFEQKKTIELIVRQHLESLLTKKIEQYLSELNRLFYRGQQDNPDYAIAFWAGALMGIISLAVKNNDFENVEKLSDLIEKIATGQYFKPSA